MDGSNYETVLLVKNEVFVYNIPPRQSTTRGYRASDWNLGSPDWTGRMRLVANSSGADCVLKLEDKLSGELFAKCPIDTYPGLAVQSVSDSSRYFVVHVKDDSGKSAYIGIGFADRSDSFDLNVALQDHFKWVKKTQEISLAPDDSGPQLDLKFKEGQMINIKMNISQKNLNQPARPRPKQAGGSGMLPPPPGGVKLPPPPGLPASPSHGPSSSSSSSLANDLFLLPELGGGGGSGGLVSPSNPFVAAAAAAAAATASSSSGGAGAGDEWGDFAGVPATSGAVPQAEAPNTSTWVQF